LSRAFSDLVVLGFIALRQVSSSTNPSSGGGGRGPGLPSSGEGKQLPITRTGEPDFNQWATRRRALLVLAMRGLEPPLVGELADRVALSLLAQWSHETGRGASEFNFNLGGWTARRRDNFHTAADRLSGKAGFKWTAYPDLPTAVDDQLKRLIVTYPTAWALLLANPESSEWIERLGRDGYYTARPADYARAWAMNRVELGRLPR
jgi:hypothetical protein